MSPDAPRRLFLLSPAHCGGKRCGYVINERAEFDLARRVRSPQGAPLGEVFSFLSGLYFRAKLAYAHHFANPPRGVPGVLVITSNRGLLPPETPTRVTDLLAFGTVDIEADEQRYVRPMRRDLRALAKRAGDDCEAVLLGSVATGKYVDLLAEAFGDRVRFPYDFAGRGDMSRGGLMLRHLDRNEELTYVPLAGAARHGKRPPKLERRALPPLPRTRGRGQG